MECRIGSEHLFRKRVGRLDRLGYTCPISEING